ncbi:hypothetical protein [Spirosoma litoris]
MYHTILIIELVIGVAFTLGLLGWCLYWLAILSGIVRKQTKLTRRPTNGTVPGQAGRPVLTIGQKKAVIPISRQMLYTARRERD